MNKDQFTRLWPELRGRVQTHWSRLTKEELDQVQGSGDMLIGIIEEKYEEPRQAIEVSWITSWRGRPRRLSRRGRPRSARD